MADLGGSLAASQVGLPTVAAAFVLLCAIGYVWFAVRRRGGHPTRDPLVPRSRGWVGRLVPPAAHGPGGSGGRWRRLRALRRTRGAHEGDVLARPLVLAPSERPPHEPGLTNWVVARCVAHSAFFHGRCGAPGDTTRLTVRGAALRGLAHALHGTDGQDAAGAAWDERRDALYLAVADGLGSMAGSGAVAAEAVKRVLLLSLRRPAELDFTEFGPQLFQGVADTLDRWLANASRERVVQGATTLVVAEVRPVGAGAAVAVCAVGDSEAWILSNGAWDVLHHERRDGASTATRQLPRHPQPTVQRRVVPAGSVLVLASDGFASALGTQGSTLARELGRRWRTVPSALEFLTHVDFVDDVYTDDRSAVAVWIG